MKKLTLLITLACLIQVTAISQPCLPEGITFTAQAQIDSFQINYPNCTEIEGDVEIGIWDCNISNLNGLSVLTSIGGELSINKTQFLTNLSGLSNLTSIGDGLVIGDNDSLQNLTGLEGLTSVGGNLEITFNEELISLTGLEGLTSIGGYIAIYYNDTLTSLSGLENLASLGGNFFIHSNNELISLTGLEGLTSIGGNLEITDNDELMDLSGLENLASLGGNLIIGDYEGNDYWPCNGNSSLNDISSLNNLTSITGNLYVICNTSLTDLYGLHNITSVGGDLIISSNGSLVNLLSLSQLDTIYGNLGIGFTLEWFSGLYQLGNQSITDLSGLDNLDYVGGNLNILGNDSLNSLTGLDNLNAASILNLSIIDNANLSDCEAQSICSYLASPNGIVEIRNNAPGCNNPGEVASECGFSMPCLPYGNYFLLSQADVDNFQNNYQGCTELEGNVIINGDDITNLNGLNVITSIGGYLSIRSNDALTSLTGLDNLTFIGGSLSIKENYNALTSLTGLNNLTSIGGNLEITFNEELISLTGLEGLTSIGGYIAIYYNNALTNLTGLEGITSIGGDLSIRGNDALTSLTGLDNVTSIGGSLAIGSNEALISLTGLDKLEAASIDNLTIIYNSSLSLCEAEFICEYLSNPNGEIEIHDNAPGCNSMAKLAYDCGTTIPCLTVGNYYFYSQDDIDYFPLAFPGCDTLMVGVTVNGNDITNLDGLNVITSIGGYLSIRSNNALTSLTGLDNVTSIGGDLGIYYNDALVSLEGLENLTSIGEDLIIGSGFYGIPGNPSLTSLTALSNLTSIGGMLEIVENDALTSLSGLDNIDAGSITALYIVGNGSLSTCEVQSVCYYLASPNGNIDINDNDQGCNSQDEVELACAVSVDEAHISDKLLIYPNPFTTSTTIEYELQQPSTVQITIYNHLGKQLKVIEQKQSSGKQQVLWNAEGLPVGIYFCVLKTHTGRQESGMKTMKMIKLK